MRILNVFCIAFIRVYRWVVAPIFISLGVQCRFEPSCSEYAIQSFKKHGPMDAFLLTSMRIGRCHPFCKGGHDPVPDEGIGKKVSRSMRNIRRSHG